MSRTLARQSGEVWKLAGSNQPRTEREHLGTYDPRSRSRHQHPGPARVRAIADRGPTDPHSLRTRLARARTAAGGFARSPVADGCCPKLAGVLSPTLQSHCEVKSLVRVQPSAVVVHLVRSGPEARRTRVGESVSRSAACGREIRSLRLPRLHASLSCAPARNRRLTLV